MNLENLIDSWLLDKNFKFGKAIVNETGLAYTYFDSWMMRLDFFEGLTTVYLSFPDSVTLHITDPDFFKKLEPAIKTSVTFIDSLRVWGGY